MAVVTVKGAGVTNNDAVPFVADNIRYAGARLKRVADQVAVSSGDSIGSIYRILRVHSSWSIASLKLFNTAITTCAGSVGLYAPTTRSSGAVVLAAAYANAISLASASTTGTELIYSVKTIPQIRQQIWLDAGLAADPFLWYDLAVTLTAAAGSAGNMAFELAVSVGD